MANFEPVTRIEKLLSEIAENTSGGGGGGGAGLPAVTSEDNGDVLTVVDGAWDKAAPSGGNDNIFVVHFTYDEEAMTTVETLEDIYNALYGTETTPPKKILYEGNPQVFCTDIGETEGGFVVLLYALMVSSGATADSKTMNLNMMYSTPVQIDPNTDPPRVVFPFENISYFYGTMGSGE